MSDAGARAMPSGDAVTGPDRLRAGQPDLLNRHAGVWLTWTACVLFLVVFGWAVSQLTQGYEHWTFEALRRAAAARGEIQAPVVTLRDSTGATAALLDDPAAGAYLVDFFYTRCPSVCQALGSEFSQMQQALQRDSAPDVDAHAVPHVRLLSVSIDPAHDDTAALAGYGRQHSSDPQWWRIAAPTTFSGRALLLSQLGVVAVPDGFGGFVHNGDLHLLDRRGRLRQVFDYADWQRALAAARQVSQEDEEEAP